MGGTHEFCSVDGVLEFTFFVRLFRWSRPRGKQTCPPKKKKKKLDRAKWCGEWGTILYGNPKGALALKIEVSLGKKYTGQIMKPVSRCAYSPQTVTCKLILKYIQFTGPASNYVRQFCQCWESAWFLWQVIESSDVNSVGYGEDLTLPSASMSLGGPGKNHCSIKGHKKGINLNLVYNAMPFKLIHLACAPELPVTPSIPHSLCQCSLSTGGLNVNSTTACRLRALRDAERQKQKMKTERKERALQIHVYTEI